MLFNSIFLAIFILHKAEQSFYKLNAKKKVIQWTKVSSNLFTYYIYFNLNYILTVNMKGQTKIIDDKAHLPAIYVEHLGEKI